MKRLQFTKQWNAVSKYQLYGVEELSPLAINWPIENVCDFLTGVPNRQSLDKALHLALEEAEKQGSGFGIIMFDLDNFKKVNDTYGHQTGDEVLQELCRRAKAVLRKEDYLARYGGEEFILLTASFEQIFSVGERVRIAVCQTPFSYNQGELAVTCSFGCAVYPRDGMTAKKVIEKADQALYKAKENGKNQGWECNRR